MSVDATAVSRVVGVSTEFKNFETGRAVRLPQRVAVIGQGNTASTFAFTKFQSSNPAEIATKYGYGSPLHLAALQLFPKNGDGIGSIPVTFYPIDDAATGVVATGSIAGVGTQTAQKEYKIKVNNIESESVVIPVGTTASAAITLFKNGFTGTLKFPVLAGANTGVETTLPITSKWKGLSANDIQIEIEGEESGIAFTVTQPTGGLVNPDVDDALDQIGDIWETIILNLLNYDDTDTLDKLSTFGEGRWGELVKKPLFAVSGSVDVLATRTAITDARKTDRTNVVIPSPGSKELPFVIAARAVSRIAKQANNNPPVNYKQILSGLQGGTDAQQETWTQRDEAVKKGSSNTVLVDGQITLNDTVTMYHPTGEDTPAYRYVVDIVKLQNSTFNVRLIFEAEEWKGAPLLPDATPTTNSAAKKPKDALTVLGNLADELAKAAIISDPEFTKKNMTAGIDSLNPKRLNTTFPIKLSGNTEIIDVTQYFGFYFGS